MAAEGSDQSNEGVNQLPHKSSIKTIELFKAEIINEILKKILDTTYVCKTPTLLTKIRELKNKEGADILKLTDFELKLIDLRHHITIECIEEVISGVLK
jgi:hypothetical protein